VVLTSYRCETERRYPQALRWEELGVKQAFDLAVIGTGAAASTVATKCRAAGWSVAIIDSRPFGGTCALRGCDPKKVLVGAAEIIDWTHRMQGKGIRAERLGIDWQQLMRFKRSFTEPVPKSREQAFLKSGIASFHGRARFVSATTVQVGDDLLEGRHIVIATGQKPADLKFPGAERLITSDKFLELDSLPHRIVFIGGGYIGFEFAHIAARAGSGATIVHRGPRPLPRFDPDLVDQLITRTRELGVEVHLATQAEAIEQYDDHLIVRASTSGETRTIEADMVVHSAGRVPEIDDLNLASAGIERDNSGVKVNEFLQSISNPAVYAAGDAAASGGLPLTPVAGYEGSIAAANLLNGNSQKPNYLGIPTVVFAIPPLASVGLSEPEARRQNLRFKVTHETTSSWYSSRRIGESHSGFKVLVEEGTDRILGAHVLGEEAGEVINLFAVAIRNGIRASDFKQTLFAYPTHGSNLPYML
jgi:glutathione reductase (NADPH)